MLSGLVTLGTDDSNQICIAHVILGNKVIHINLHHHQAIIMGSLATVRESQSKDDKRLQISRELGSSWDYLGAFAAEECNKSEGYYLAIFNKLFFRAELSVAKGTYSRWWRISGDSVLGKQVTHQSMVLIVTDISHSAKHQSWFVSPQMTQWPDLDGE